MVTESFTNISNVANNSETLDNFCADLLVGPVVWAVFSVPCACLGVPASVWLLWVLIQRQRYGLTNDIYMLNLTIMDLIFNTLIIPDVLNVFVWKRRLYWEIGAAFQLFSLCGRPLLMACVCADCYVAVVHPIMYVRLKRSKYRMVTCAVIWVLTLGWGITSFVLGEYVPNIFIFIPSLFALLSILPCDVIIFCALRKPDPSGRSNVHPQKQRALQAIANSLVMTIVSYLPPIIVQIILQLVSVSPRVELCYILYPMAVFSMLGSTIMPLLYLGNLGTLNTLGGKNM